MFHKRYHIRKIKYLLELVLKRKESILTKKQKVRDSYSTSRHLNFNVNQYLNFEAAAESEISSNNFLLLFSISVFFDIGLLRHWPSLTKYISYVSRESFFGRDDATR